MIKIVAGLDNEGMELGEGQKLDRVNKYRFMSFPYLYMLAVLEEDEEVDYFDM